MPSVVIVEKTKSAVPAKIIEAWVRSHLKARGAKNEVNLELQIVGEAKITKLNQLYMGKSGPTDVLSFPLEQIPGEKVKFVGSIVICNNKIKAQAIENKVPYELEFKKALSHGIDHLLGIHHA